MKIINSKNKKTPIFLILAIALLLLGYGAVSYAYRIWPFTTKTTPVQSSTQKKEATVDNNSSLKTSTPSPTSNKSVDATKTTNEIPQNQSLSLTITNLSQDSNSVSYSATLGDTSQNGSCVAEFTSSGAKPVTSTTNAINGNCGPVNIPIESFTKLGTWTLTLHYYTNNTQVNATETINIH